MAPMPRPLSLCLRSCRSLRTYRRNLMAQRHLLQGNGSFLWGIGLCLEKGRSLLAGLAPRHLYHDLPMLHPS